MTFFPWSLNTSRKATPDLQLRSAVPQVLRTTPRVPAEYQALQTYLERRFAGLVVLTFEQIESLIGFPLPSIARSDTTWWTGDAGPAARHVQAWTTAHRTATPNLLARTVTFERLP